MTWDRLLCIPLCKHYHSVFEFIQRINIEEFITKMEKLRSSSMRVEAFLMCIIQHFTNRKVLALQPIYFHQSSQLHVVMKIFLEFRSKFKKIFNLILKPKWKESRWQRQGTKFVIFIAIIWNRAWKQTVIGLEQICNTNVLGKKY